MEITFFNSFCRGANLKAFWAGLRLDGTVGQIKTLFQRYFGTEFYGTLLSDLEALDPSMDRDKAAMDSGKCSTLSAQAHQQLTDRLNVDDSSTTYFTGRPQRTSAGTAEKSMLSPQVQYRRKFACKGATYTTVQQSQNDCMVIFHPNLQEEACAGQIQDIFVHARRGADGSAIAEYFISVLAFRRLGEEEAKRVDPYRRYPLLNVQLYRDEFIPVPFLIKASDVISHCATCPYKSLPEYKVVLSLNRVRALFV